jgi:membrane-associated phospholipid phosphatase
MTTGDPVLDFVLSLRAPAATAAMRAVSAASSPEAYLAILPVVYWLISRRVGIILLAADAVASLGAVVAKGIVAAPRPPDAGESAWLARTETAHAFPSGHATSTASTCFTVAALFPALRAFAVAAALTVLVAVSRLYLGLHYSGDVAAGAALGLVVAFSVVAAAPRAGPMLARLPLGARASLGLLFLPVLLVNSGPPALIIACSAAGAFCGHALADAWGWRVPTGNPRRLPAYGALRLLLGMPVLIGIGVGLGDPLTSPALEVAARFLVLGAFVTLLGPRLFMAAEGATPWTGGFRRRPSH